MMKTFGTVFLAIMLIAGLAFGESVQQKAALEDAANAYHNNTASEAQLQLLKASGFNGDTPVIDEAGGPDAYGYIYKDSQEADGPTFSWIDDTMGTVVADSGDIGDDAYAGPFALDHAFTFYGTDYTEFYLHSNGGISFNDPGDDLSLSNSHLPYTSDPFVGIIFFQDDLDPAEETVTLTVTADAQVITGTNWYEYPDGNGEGFDVQVVLYDNGEILIQYDNLHPDLDISSETIGIQSLDGDMGFLEVSYNTTPDAYPFSGLALWFGMLEADASLSGYVYDVNDSPIEGATVSVNGADYVTDATGFYEFPELYSGDADYQVTAEGYMGQNGTLTLMPGTNSVDFVLEMLNTEADVLVVDWDEVPDSAMEIANILNALGYTTYYVDATNWDSVNWMDYEYVFTFFGVYSDNFAISTGDPEETAMVDYLTAGGTMYMEGGDLLYYDAPENLLALLNVDAWSDGGSDLDNVDGVVGTFTEGMTLAYAGDSSWIDHIDGIDGSITFLTNPADGAGCGIIDSSMPYNYAACSFELGMLVDGDGANTRADIVSGIFDYWNNPPMPDPIELSLSALNTTIPAEGGVLAFDAAITNNTGQMQTGGAWTMVVLPNGNSYGPLMQTQVNLPAGTVNPTGLTQNVPGAAPDGLYTFQAFIGFYPNFIVAMDSFDFDKMPPIAASGNPVNNWDASEWTIAGDAGSMVNLPEAYALNAVYPNPFNPTANVSVALPNASDLTVSVFNVMGQQVAELASGQFQAGQHNFVLDGANLTSGVYFVQAHVPGELNAVQKVTLMK